MRTRFLWVFAALLACSTTGCVSGDAPSSSWAGIARPVAGMRRSWDRLTEDRQQPPPPAWNWASAIPAGAPRAELFPAVTPSDAVAQFVPQWTQYDIQLASTHQAAPLGKHGFQISNVGGHPVTSVADLNRALDQAAIAHRKVQVDLVPAFSAGSQDEVAVEVDLPALYALCHSVADDQPVMKAAEDGNPWLIVRSRGIRAKLMVRLERNHDLLQVVLSLTNCWDPTSALPIEVQAAADGAPMRCLTVAETLDVLYSDRLPPGTAAAAHSFASVSERDDYRVPVNYAQLEQQVSGGRRTSSLSAGPALATVAGTPYPGSCVLGDARALSGFLLQRAPLSQNEGERVGWVMFHAPAARRCSSIDVSLDLGQGPRTYRFLLPQGTAENSRQ